MKLLKTSFFSAVVTLVKISSSFAASKVIAMYTGPSGVAIIGQFYNLTSIIVGFANGGIGTGVVKFTSEYDGDTEKQKSLYSTSMRISGYCSLLLGSIVAIFSKFLSQQFFNTPEFTYPIIIFGITLVFYAFNTLLISIINGKREIRFYTIVNCVGSLITLILTLLLVYLYHILGALYALVFSQVLVFIITLIFVIRKNWFKWDYFNKSIDRNMLLNLAEFSLMALLASITLPLTQIFLRNFIISELGMSSAGLWQGMMRISDGYLMIVTISLSTYYVPKLSNSTDSEIKSEMWQGFKLIMPLVFASCVAIYLLRNTIISLLFTKQFLPMENLFLFQLLGDFFKVACYLLITLMVTKKLTKAYVITEIIFNVSYVILGYYLTSIYGLQGVTQAFAVVYFLCLCCLIIFFRKILFNKHESFN